MFIGEEDKTISADDYFKKSSNFRVWLKNEKNIYFDELNSDRAHELFDVFVEKWNDGLNVKMILVNYIHSIYSRGFKILSKKIGFTKYFFFCFISKMERVELFLKIFYCNW